MYKREEQQKGDFEIRIDDVDQPVDLARRVASIRKSSSQYLPLLSSAKQLNHQRGGMARMIAPTLGPKVSDSTPLRKPIPNEAITFRFCKIEDRDLRTYRGQLPLSNLAGEVLNRLACLQTDQPFYISESVV